MAPCSYNSAYINLSTREKNKLRKPAVEKMRRDRINSSIEQLKTLLQAEFRERDPSGRLEKADVLELTVSFLKQWLQQGAAVSQRSHHEGYSQCWMDTLRFLSASSKGDAAVQRLRHFQNAQREAQGLCPKNSLAPVKQDTPIQPTVWRPW